MGTGGIKALMAEVLNFLPQPHTEDAIDEVFLAIEARPDWLARYEALVDEHGKTTVNTFAGWWVARLEERSGDRVVPSKSRLLGSYSKLGGRAQKKPRKLKLDEARVLMSTYYMRQKADLPASVRDQRLLILELITEGASPEEAFAQAIAAGSAARRVTR